MDITYCDLLLGSDLCLPISIEAYFPLPRVHSYLSLPHHWLRVHFDLDSGLPHM
jgi:hypothetical protein